MLRVSLLCLALETPVATAWAQHPLVSPRDAVELRFSTRQPVLSYTLRVNPLDLSGFEVSLTIRNAPDSFEVAMAAHPEYDDQYWRFLDELRVDGAAGARVVRLDSALWRVTAPGGATTLRYRLGLPPATDTYRSAWKPFLSTTGGLVGGPHSFLYLVAAPLAPAHVTLQLPEGWQAATGLEPTSDPLTFFAPSAEILIDCPILIGKFRSWRWAIDGVPHRLIYWPLPNGAPFDSAALVRGVEAISRQAVEVFGRPPYREYSFLLQDGAVGALEHLNSVTLGAATRDLNRNPWGVLPEVSHEFFHTWNLLRIRPAEYRGLDYRPQPPTSGLWFSEGLSMFYSDLLMRRAGLPTFDSTRTVHLQRLLTSFLASPGYSRFSAEQVSRVAYNAPPGSLGDYDASTHVQGEVLGTMLDFVVRSATRGRRSMDHVMRAMLERYAGERGFLGADIRHTVESVCGCALAGFFAAFVHGATPLDYNRYLALAGLRATVTRQPVMNGDRPAPDLRIRAWLPPHESHPSLLVLNPESVWGRAGLHTGDRLLTVNGSAIGSVAEFRTLLGRIGLGDTLRVEIQRPAGTARVVVVAAGYDRPTVRIEDLPGASPLQRAIRDAWRAGAP
jgi:predicted metalloprotease with PDZ domain